MAAALQRPDPRLEQTLFGCRFANPVGLAAGFDKNAVAAGIWQVFGFGFAELGTVTALSQPGNPRPRLFRLAAEQAALNRMGFNNRGAEAVERILQAQVRPLAGQRMYSMRRIADQGKARQYVMTRMSSAQRKRATRPGDGERTQHPVRRFGQQYAEFFIAGFQRSSGLGR